MPMRCVLKNDLIPVIGLALLSAAPGAIMAAPAAQWSVEQQWNVGGAGGWDYLTLDASGRRLFVSRATRVDVVSTESGKVIGTIPDTSGVHGIALAADLRRGFASNGKADSVTVFDLDTLKTIKEVKIGAQNPDAILYEPREHVPGKSGILIYGSNLFG